MKIPVEIMVSTSRLDYRDPTVIGDRGEPKESMDSYNGILDIKGKSYTLSYVEELDNGIVLDTSVMYKDGIALISRRSDINTNLVYNVEKPCDCVYNSGNKQFNLRVRTTRIKSDICNMGGKLFIDYTVDIMGNVAEKVGICISVCPTESAS